GEAGPRVGTPPALFVSRPDPGSLGARRAAGTAATVWAAQAVIGNAAGATAWKGSAPIDVSARRMRASATGSTVTTNGSALLSGNGAWKTASMFTSWSARQRAISA